MAAMGSPLTRLTPLRAWALCTLLVLVIAAVLVPFGPDLTRAVHVILLVVPVVAAAILGGRAVAIAVMGESAVALALFLPPLGKPAVTASDDIAALVLFAVVAGILGSLVATIMTSERRRTEADRERLAALESAEQQRKALLRSVSHDLRTPLATIRAATDELDGDIAHDDATRHELSGLVIKEVDRLDRIVANLLSLSRIEAGALLPDLQPIDLEDVVRAGVDRLGTMAGGVGIEVDAEPGLPLVAGDFSQLDQVVTNLVENAVRHSPPTGIVRCELRTASDAVVLRVADQGSGFDPQVRARAFDPFAAATGAGSSGIGLAICRSIVDAHHGTIEIGDAPGGGAVVSVTIPRPTDA